jgi:hypothetical protein
LYKPTFTVAVAVTVPEDIAVVVAVSAGVVSVADVVAGLIFLFLLSGVYTMA